MNRAAIFALALSLAALGLAGALLLALRDQGVRLANLELDAAQQAYRAQRAATEVLGRAQWEWIRQRAALPGQDPAALAALEGELVRFDRLYGELPFAAALAGEREKLAAELSRRRLDAGLVLYLRLDEGAGLTAYDSAPDHLPGRLVGMSGREWTAGARENALALDGQNDRIQVEGLVAPRDNFSFGAWIKARLPRNGGGGWNYDGRGQRYLFHPGGEAAGAGLAAGADGLAVCERDNRNNLPPRAVFDGPVGTDWRHVMVVYRDRVPTIYLDGRPVATGTATGDGSVLAPTGVGGGEFGHFPGLVDEVRIYDRPLAPAEVRALCADGPAPAAAPPPTVPSTGESPDFDTL